MLSRQSARPLALQYRTALGLCLLLASMNLRIADFTTTTVMLVACMTRRRLLHAILAARVAVVLLLASCQDILTSQVPVWVAITSEDMLTRHLWSARCCARLKQAVCHLRLVWITVVLPALSAQTNASCRMVQDLQVAMAGSGTVTFM